MKKSKKKTPTYNMTWSDIENIKRDASKKALDIAFKHFLILNLMVLRDNYDFGTKRLERYLDNINNMLDSYNKGYLDISDMKETLKIETGIEIL